MGLPQVDITKTAVAGRELALGGGLEGAERTSRETANWNVGNVPPDRAINGVKDMGDMRAKDMVVNDGFARGAVQIGMDSIVGAQYRLNAKPAWKSIPGADEVWAEEFAQAVEGRWALLAESQHCYLDATGMNTFTGLIRLGVASFIMTGESLVTSEWDRSAGRPLFTCFQTVDPSRLKNPNYEADKKRLRRGVKVDGRGKPIGYFIQTSHPGEFYYDDFGPQDYKYVPRFKPWGRPQVFHVIEQLFPDQHRGVADMVSVLKRMRMTKHLQEVVLQNAVINATYVAAIESEMPTAEMIVSMGGDEPGSEAYENAVGSYLQGLQDYLKGAGNIDLDGAMIPHLYPGTKLNAKTLGTPGAVGTDFEASLLRNIAAGLGIDYAEFARDYSKMSYATAKLSDAKTVRNMQSRKKNVADKLALGMYSNVVEEFVARWDDLPLPRGFNRDDYYSDPLLRDAFSRATFIGSGRGQIDELRETQAAMLRIKAGFSTYEIEIARLGEDYREVFEQQAREAGLRDRLGLVFDLGTNRANTGQGGDGEGDPPETDEDQDDEDIDDDGTSSDDE